MSGTPSLPIHVRKRGRMRLRERNAARILRREIAGNIVSLKRDHTIRRALLFEPREPESMRLQRRHNIRQSIAVDVVNPHISAPPPPKFASWNFPQLAPFARRQLLKPNP